MRATTQMVKCSIVTSLLLLPLAQAASAGAAAEAAKLTVYGEKTFYGELADNLSSAFEILPLPTDGDRRHPLMVDGLEIGPAEAELIASFYEAGLPVIVVGFSDQARTVLADMLPVGSGVDQIPSDQPALAEPALEAVGFRLGSQGLPDIGNFYSEFDGHSGPTEEEEAEDDAVVSSIASWVTESRERPPMAKASAAVAEQPSIDDLVTAVVRKVTTTIDRGSISTVIRGWAAYSLVTDEDWYIFELTTTSQPLNFRSRSKGAVEAWENTDKYCKGLVGMICQRERYASEVAVAIRPVDGYTELIYYGPSSDRQQDEYSYSSEFSIGGGLLLGFEASKKDGAKGKAELSLNAGASFRRGTTVKIPDAVVIGISDPTRNSAGWRYEMPKLRAVRDLSAVGGPVRDCDQLLQYPYPVQRGSLETRQYAIYRLSSENRQKLGQIKLKVFFKLTETTSELWNGFTKDCNAFNCACTPRHWNNKVSTDEQYVSFPLAAREQ